MPSSACRPRRGRGAPPAATRSRQRGRGVVAGREHQARRCLRASRPASGGRSPGRHCSRSRAFRGSEQIIEDNNVARAAGGQVWPQISVGGARLQMNLARTLHLQSGAVSFAAVDERRQRGAAGGVPGSGMARAPRVGRDLDAKTMHPAGELRRRSRSPNPRRHPDLVGRRVVPDLADGARVHPARRHARSRHSTDRSRHAVPVSVLANNDPDAIAWLLQQDRVPARSRRLRRACQPVVRRLSPHRPPRQLGAGEGGHRRSNARSTSSPRSRRRSTASTPPPAAAAGSPVGMAADITVFDSGDRRSGTVAPHPRLPRRR